jgi:truncated hemoglobin YjbI
MQEVEVYSVIGAEAFTRLVAAFYRLVRQDDILGPMYQAQDLSGAERRLRDFLIGRFGGAADLHRTKRPSSPPRAPFSVFYQSDCPRPMDAFDE